MDNQTTIYVYHDNTTINRCLATLTLVSVVYLAALKIRCGVQRLQIYKMSKDIEELKKAKGE